MVTSAFLQSYKGMLSITALAIVSGMYHNRVETSNYEDMEIIKNNNLIN